jgi:aryl-alcohol dehydrogenase-like predicted oxidoreductase
LLSVKFGALRGPDGSWGGMDTRPAAIKNFLGYTLTRLGVDAIDIYRPARLDPNVPIEDTIGAIADLKQAGYVRYIGLSEVGPETIRRAQAVHPIVDLQIEYSLVSRGPEDKIVPTMRELGIAMTAYGVLSRGLLAGSRPAAAGDYRAHLPRFAGDNGAKNQRLVDALAKLAQERGVAPAALAIAWVLSRGKDIIPVMGARTRQQLEQIPVALELKLTADELKRIEEAVPVAAVAGTRYQEAQMKHLDSELGPLQPS